MCLRFLASVFLLASLGCAHRPAPEPRPFTICAEPENLPMSEESSRTGYEIEIAELLAKSMGEPLQVKWVPQRDYSFYGQTIGKGKCDALMGVPSSMPALETTKPYYRTGFVFVTRGKAIPSLDDRALKTMKIGVPATGLGETPAAMMLARRGLHTKPFSIFQPRAMIEAVQTREIDAALVWGPFAGYFGRLSSADSTPQGRAPPLKLSDAPAKDGSIPLALDISIGVRKGNDELRAKLDEALERERPTIREILEKWRVPCRELRPVAMGST